MGDAMEIEVVSAIQLPDVERMRNFGVKMDPYCVLQSGKESVKTKRAHGGGRSPNWHQTVRLELQPGDSEIAVQVFNYSKLGSHDEVARASVSIPSKYRQGERQWEQRVAMQPVAKKGALWGGEVFLRLKYASPQPQEAEERRQTWPGQQYPSSMQNLGQQNGESSHDSPTHAGLADGSSRMGSKLSRPFKQRATTDGIPQSLDASAPGLSLGSSEANDSLGHSPKPASSLYKALDKVLRKVGARDRSHTSLHPVDTSVGTGATLSGHTSRRSSLGSMGLPEHPSLPEAVFSGDGSSSRHNLMPGWQEGDGHIGGHLDGKPRVSSATQTESPNSQHDGKLSSMNLSGLSGVTRISPMHSAPSPAQPVAVPAQQPLYKEPSFAVTDGHDLYHSPEKAEPPKPCEAMLTAEKNPEEQRSVPIVAQTGAVAIPIRGDGTPSQSRRSCQEQPSSWKMAGMPAPASPFAEADDDFTFDGSHASERDGGHSVLPGLSSLSMQPGTSPGQESMFALRQCESSTSQQAQHERRASSPMTDNGLGRGRRSLESADSAYTAMHAERQHNVELNALRGNAAAALHPASDAGRSAAHDHALQLSDGRSDLTAGYSRESSMVMSPAIGLPPKPQPSPFLQSDALDHEADEAPSPLKKEASYQPSTRLQYRHSTGSGMQPLETSALQAGLKTMPNRIPPLPEMVPLEEHAGESGANGEECNGHDDVSNVEKPAMPEEPVEKVESADRVPAGRPMRKTLSRKSPFLPEVLPSMIKHEDITYTQEYGQTVLLGEGSFGQVYKAQYLHCDVAVKKLNRINDKKSDEAFRREAAILKGCRNPYIVNFMGVCKDEAGRICLVTELMDTSLMSALSLPDDENKSFQYYADGKHILMCIIKALIYLHAYNIAHLDIKSPNVLLNKGDAKVADVGLSQLLSRSFANSCSFGVGTFSWAATELLLGSHPVTTAADIFSFGVVMWEVCTLEQPANRYMRTIEDHEAPPAIRKLFHDCIQENPASRPTAKQVLEVLMQH